MNQVAMGFTDSVQAPRFVLFFFLSPQLSVSYDIPSELEADSDR